MSFPRNELTRTVVELLCRERFENVVVHSRLDGTDWSIAYTDKHGRRNSTPACRTEARAWCVLLGHCGEFSL